MRKLMRKEQVKVVQATPSSSLSISQDIISSQLAVLKDKQLKGEFGPQDTKTLFMLVQCLIGLNRECREHLDTMVKSKSNAELLELLDEAIAVLKGGSNE